MVNDGEGDGEEEESSREVPGSEDTCHRGGADPQILRVRRRSVYREKGS
jgi:hypothetical protein